MPELTDQDRAILDLAGEGIRGEGRMAREIYARFGWSTTRYYQRLNALAQRREAIEYDPITCRRIAAVAAG